MPRKKILTADQMEAEAFICGVPISWAFKYEDLVKNDEQDETFHIGQCYEEEAAATLVCVKCDGKVFNVGQGSYFTAIRCVKCEWEVCIHDG